jgi:hypothetical protein
VDDGLCAAERGRLHEAGAEQRHSTLYRRFPNRSDFVAAVFRREVDACAAAARVLAEELSPGEALLAWLKRYVLPGPDAK